jgi:predicted Zn finger-like uncharacterized protein
MNVTCPNCATVYRVDPAKVPDTGVRARCSVCSAVFAVRRDELAGARPASVPVGPVAGRAAPAAPSSAAPEAPKAEMPRPPAPTPAAPSAPAPMPVAPAPAAAPATASPPPASAPVRPAGFPPPAVPATAARPAPAPPASPAARPAVSAPAAAPNPAFTAPASAPAAAPGPAAAQARPAAGPGTRPVNPFLSQDPALKARRLARALISDMVVYHPAKRQEGLRDGTLRQLFEDEIKKSWEEYADQVGRDVADSTPYFKEALNEILAGGRQIF